MHKSSQAKQGFFVKILLLRYFCL